MLKVLCSVCKAHVAYLPEDRALTLPITPEQLDPVMGQAAQPVHDSYKRWISCQFCHNEIRREQEWPAVTDSPVLTDKGWKPELTIEDPALLARMNELKEGCEPIPLVMPEPSLASIEMERTRQEAVEAVSAVPAVILPASGKPYQTKNMAVYAGQRKKDGGPYEPVPVEGGWGLQEVHG